MDEQKYADAIWDVTKAIDLNPAYAEAYNHRGLIYLKMKYSDRALGDFERAMELDYRLAVAHYNLGVTYNALGRFDEALGEFDRAFLLGYEQAGLWAIWGATLLSVNRFEQAINKLSEAIIRDPQIAEVYTYRANAYIQRGAAYYGQARIDLESSLRRNPNLVDAHNQLGNLAFRQENYRAAVKHYQRALELRPGLFSARYSLVLSAYNQRELELAIEQFSILNYFAPKQDLSEAQRAQLAQLATLLDLDDATRQELEETLKLNRSLGNPSGEALTLRQLGIFHYQRGEFAQAHSFWQSALAGYKQLAQDDVCAAIETNLANMAARLEQIKALEAAEEANEEPLTIG